MNKRIKKKKETWLKQEAPTSIGRGSSLRT